MMHIYFGLALDDNPIPLPTQTQGAVRYLGPRQFLQFLEAYFGLSGYSNDNEYLRIEQYRQALRLFLDQHPHTFFKASFEADQFATAMELLERRDELLLAGWTFQASAKISEPMPNRLQCLSAIEQLIQSPDFQFDFGEADRYQQIIKCLEKDHPPIDKIQLLEQEALLPPHLQRLLEQLRQQNIPVLLAPEPRPSHIAGDLQAFQKYLLEDHSASAKKSEKGVFQADGSLVLLKAKRDADLASFVAKTLLHKPDYRPSVLLSENGRIFDNALIQEGLPSLGTSSASLARPTLQVLKLVTAFLWNPIDPFKILEFVSLAVKPLDDELANRIAMQIAQRPGLNSDSWKATIASFFDEWSAKAQEDNNIKLDLIRYQYRFWFERKRFDSNGLVPKEEVIHIFSYLTTWARESLDENSNEQTSLLVLSEQARRIKELLEALPETQLSKLELERIVRTIYEPAPIQFTPRELEALPSVEKPNGIIEEVDELLWWTFTQSEANHFFSRWYQAERAYLQQFGIELLEPTDENALQIWQRKQGFLKTRKRVVLLIPEVIHGSGVHPHPLLGDLEARFENLHEITVNLDQESNLAFWKQHFHLPERVKVERIHLGQPKPFIYIQAAEQLQARPEETISSLESLFYYPYQWVFRHKIKLKKSSILEVVKDNALIGNLAHRFFEKLLLEDIQHMSQEAIHNWVEMEARRLLEREGAVLLMYGREPERVNFLNTIKYAAWSMVNYIRNNKWEVDGTEARLQGTFLHIPINGRADLVLRRGDEKAVVDLKWRGDRRRESIIKNEEDLQLVLYSKLLDNDQTWAHTAYFIIEKGKIIARNQEAFQDITPVAPESDHIAINERIFDKMKATYQWRIEQIKRGQIEIRCSQTSADLEEAYDNLMDVLEMKDQDAYFDDYRTLINLIS